MKNGKDKILKFITCLTAAVIMLAAIAECYSQQDNLQITYSRNLDFRELIPGVRKTVSETSPDAGKIVIRNYGVGCMVGVSFNISGGISSGGDFMQTTFTATQSVNPNDNQPGIPFNPYSGTTLTFDDKTKEYYIRIGGTVNPVEVQKAGNYNTPVIIILTILSN
ncbi:MAG: hypothetical protein LWX07_01260 [Bacteroidetes bacterium]|nr:hypothetical protein [Bacteroidota bacterium]